MPPEPTPQQRQALEAYADALQDAAETLAELAAGHGLIEIRAVGITVLTEDDWCASTVWSPRDWDKRKDAMFLLNSARQYVEAAGGQITVVESGDEPVRSMPRNRRRHRRRR